MNNAPTYLDLTVEEHLGYIERQYPLHEDQYEYVCKLRQKVETELKDLKDKADLSVTSLCEKLKLTRKSFEVSTIDSHIRYLASRKIEKFFLSIEEEVKTRLSTLKNPSLIQSIEELYNLLESYRNTPELRANAEVDITLFPKETFDTEIQAVKGLVNELQKILAVFNK
ncbi:MAG: hypothetical protein EOM45_11800 [Clostridia bacterium]|nr:hypothetical protein [Clostridia bacterium]